MRQILTALALFTFSFSFSARAQQTQTPPPQTYQDGTAYGSQKTIQQQGDKTVIQEQTGRINNRQGGPRVGEINESETHKVETRIKALRLTSVGLGPYGSAVVDGHPMHYGVSLYKHFEAGVNGEILLGAMGAFSGDSAFLFAGIGGSYLFSTEDISPIVGAEFGLADADYKREGASSINEGGFAAKVNGGMRFFRTSDTQMEVLATYMGILSNHNPGIFGLEVRVLF